MAVSAVELRLWVSLTELTVIGGLGVTLMVWLVRAALRKRRKKRAIERFLASAGPSRQSPGSRSPWTSW